MGNALRGRSVVRSGVAEQAVVSRQADEISGSGDEEPPGLAIVGQLPPKARFPTGRTSVAFRRRFFPGVKAEDWNDWHWQLRHRIRSAEELRRIFTLSAHERGAVEWSHSSIPLSITPYYASLMSRSDSLESLRR
ncbi:MAG: hypothetical protein HQL57_11715, partial [Magnetococcales bacterium]|nr:hypothetical protein [Magnetococcales bacterium]